MRPPSSESERLAHRFLFGAVAEDYASLRPGDEYLRLLGTYSDHLRVDAARRSALFARIGDVIDREYGGAVVRPYRTVMHLALRGG